MFDKLNPFAGPTTVSEVTDLRIYPIKSCRGISLRKSYLTRRGLDLDRKWMFVDAETLKFVTIRDISEMTLIDTALASNSSTSASSSSPFSPHGDSDAGQIIISIRNTSKQVMIPARPTPQWLQENTTLHEVNIWENDTDGYIYNDDINNVFTEFFKKPVKLVYKGPTPRVLRGNGAPDLLGREESTNFPDVMPVLIVNEASITELNGRLKEKGHEEISIERFRPNIVIRGKDLNQENDKAPEAWTEDSWKTVRIVEAEQQQQSGLSSLLGGGAKGLEIDVQARCARCQVPNVDPDTAVKDKHEPWDTLVNYRRIDEGIKWKPCFGMLSAPRNEGLLAVGMRFEVVETTDKHLYVKGF